MNILVSACLLGLCTRYDGGHNLCEFAVELAKKHTLIPVCPEQMGGLPTPREPSEILNGSVISKSGRDVSVQFIKGANIALSAAKICGCSTAILKQRSPSCGFGKIYDGSFSNKVVNGNGVFAQLLIDEKIKIYTEEDAELISGLL